MSEPVAEAPSEQPGSEQPGTEQPGTEQPGSEQPGSEQLGSEQLGTELLGDRPFYGRPYVWTWFAVALFAIPAAATMVRAGAAWDEIHPALNGMLNATSAVFLVVGYFAIRQHKVALHRACMVTAFSTSTLFLASYLTRYALSGTHRYPGTGLDKILYLVILFSHMVLAAALVPMVLLTVIRAVRGDYEKHRKIAKWTWPIWIYVSVTGVIVYLMLYPIASALTS